MAEVIAGLDQGPPSIGLEHERQRTVNQHPARSNTQPVLLWFVVVPGSRWRVPPHHVKGVSCFGGR